MQTRTISFTGSHGDTLSARLGLPADRAPRACALFAHCFTCSKDLRSVVEMTRALTGEGIAVLRFDFTGLGESEGDFADTSFSSNVGDLHAAAHWMEENLEAPAILIGHSLGGAAVLQATAGLPSVRAVATIGAPFDPAHVTGLFVDQIGEIEATGEAEVVLAGRRFTVREEFLRDLEGRRMERVVRELGRPLLIFHSPVDQTVGIENAALIYEAARHPKSFISLDDADHLLLREIDSRYVGRVLAAWASRYVGAGAGGLAAPAEGG
jgi:putative redox protein